VTGNDAAIAAATSQLKQRKVFMCNSFTKKNQSLSRFFQVKSVQHLALRAPESALGGTGSIRPFYSILDFAFGDIRHVDNDLGGAKPPIYKTGSRRILFPGT
jgi:hypothetical protein